MSGEVAALSLERFLEEADPGWEAGDGSSLAWPRLERRDSDGGRSSA